MNWRRLLLAVALLPMVWLSEATQAEEPVNFEDEILQAAIEEALWISDPTPTDMLNLTSLECTQRWGTTTVIRNLKGLEYATNLRTLHLRLNQISDISPLSSLTNLTTADLSQNEIRDLSPLSGLSELSYLNLHGNQISDVSPLAGLDNLEVLVIRLNAVTDISALAELPNLRDLDFANNQVRDLSPLASLMQLSALSGWCNALRDLSPLAGLENLRMLSLSGNRIADLSPLASLGNLADLDLESNSVTDISPLANLTSLRHLDLRWNGLDQPSHDVYIPQIMANNPGITIEYDPITYVLSISSTPGGSVISPGEGEFSYDRGTSVRLEAQADPGFLFAGWTGSSSLTADSINITMDMNYRMEATFVSTLDVLYVDDDAFWDPGPGDLTVSDPHEDGSDAHPFDSIQEAIELAGEGASIRVLPGTYCENITIQGRSVSLAGRDPNDPNGTELPVIRAGQNGPVVLIQGSNDAPCTLSGFGVTNGHGTTAVIDCSDVNATISHCLIAGNRPAGYGSTLIRCTDSDVAFINCTVTDNYVGACNGGLWAFNSTVRLTNSILYHNTYDCSNAADSILYADENGQVSVTYSDIEGSWPGPGNIDKDPLFVCRGQWTDPQNPLVPRSPADSGAVWSVGDYHLLSDAGRWDAVSLDWICDGAASPCIDAGDPAGGAGCEPSPNGGVVNMGVYGGTTEASRSH